MWLINGFKSVIMIIIQLSQIDIAIIKVLTGEIASLYTVRILLNEKIFTKDKIRQTSLLSDDYIDIRI